MARAEALSERLIRVGGADIGRTQPALYASALFADAMDDMARKITIPLLAIAGAVFLWGIPALNKAVNNALAQTTYATPNEAFNLIRTKKMPCSEMSPPRIVRKAPHQYIIRCRR